MKNAVELLDVIESSHLPLTDKLVEHREDIVQLVDNHFQQTAGKIDNIAEFGADFVHGEGVGAEVDVAGVFGEEEEGAAGVEADAGVPVGEVGG